MTVVTFEWLNDGAETELKEMPLKGERELLKLKAARKKYYAATTQYQFLQLCEAAIAAKQLLEDPKFGAKEACESWNAHMKTNFNAHPGLIFKEETFERDLDSWITDFVLKRLGCTDIEESKEKLREMAEQLAEDVKGIDKERIIETNHELYLLNVYWRLRVSGVKEVQTPEGAKSIPWALDAKEDALEIISEVLTESDMEQLYEKMEVEDPEDDDLDARDLEPVAESDVEGKLRPSKGNSTESAANSVPS